MTKEQFNILDHTIHRAPGGLYCGDSTDMQILVDKGLMEFAGTKPFVPDAYFRITKLGRKVWSEYRPALPARETISKNKLRAKRRYQRFLDADFGITFREWIKKGFAK